MATNRVILKARLDFCWTSLKLFIANSFEILGTRLSTRAFVTVKGRYSRGIAIPDIFPKVPIAFMAEYPINWSLRGIRIEFAVCIITDIKRLRVIGIATNNKGWRVFVVCL